VLACERERYIYVSARVCSRACVRMCTVRAVRTFAERFDGTEARATEITRFCPLPAEGCTCEREKEGGKE